MELELRTKEKSNKKYVCPVCLKSFEWKSGLSRHEKLFHSNQSIYKCVVCGQTFTKRAGLAVHFKLHKTILANKSKANKISKIYENISETVYSSDSDCEYEILQTIVKVQVEGDKKCEVCGKAFVKQLSLKRHSDKHKRKEDQTDENLNATAYSCDSCGQSFKNACNLSNHKKLHLKESLIIKKLGANKNKVFLAKSTYPCNLCNRVYLTQSHLQNHLFSHENNGEKCKNDIQDKLYLCMVCGKRYARSSYLSLHMRTHADFRPHLCSVCGNC